MKVALVCPYDLSVPGGVQQQVIQLCTRLRARGMDSWVVGPQTPAGIGVDVGGVVSIRANGSRTPIALAPATRRRVRESVAPADVAHVHEPFMPLVGPAALSAASAAVATFHADPPALVRRLYRWLERPGARRLARAQVITAVSAVAAAALPMSWSPVTVVPNGIDTEQVAAGGRRRLRISYLGRDDRRKGLDVLLAAWPAIGDAYPGAELLVMGSQRAQAPPGVEYLGRVDEPTKKAVLASSALFVAPNLGGESFGIVVAEAMAAGCAVVASDLPAFRSVLGEAGMLFPVGDAAALAASVRMLLADPSEMQRLGMLGQERAKAFSWPAVVDRYVAAYAEALAKL